MRVQDGGSGVLPSDVLHPRFAQRKLCFVNIYVLLYLCRVVEFSVSYFYFVKTLFEDRTDISYKLIIYRKAISIKSLFC